MARTEAMQPIGRIAPVLDVLTFAGTIVAIGISADLKTLYGAAVSPTAVLYKSVDDGTTWTTVYTFTGEVVLGIRETDDGETIVLTAPADTTIGYVWRSTGWNYGAGSATATWTKTLTTASAIRPFWGGGHFNSFGDDKVRAGSSAIGVLNEYGPQSTATNAATASTRVYVTQNYGTTWTMALDLTARYPGKITLHVHSSAYDPWWDRIWVTYGDVQGDTDTTKQGLLYSDDRGATWQATTIPPEFIAANNYLQCTSIAVLEDCIILGGDNTPGYFRMSRQAYRKIGPAQVASQLVTGTGGQMIANAAHRNRRQPGAPLLLCFQTQYNDWPSGLIGTFDGLTFNDLHRDPQVNSSRTVSWTTAFGPTFNGFIVGRANDKFIRGELVYPPANGYDDIASFAGDGSTTVFTKAHQLPFTPTSVKWWSTNAAGGTVTVTVDATNVTFTFTAAPASGTYPAFGYRTYR